MHVCVKWRQIVTGLTTSPAWWLSVPKCVSAWQRSQRGQNSRGSFLTAVLPVKLLSEGLSNGGRLEDKAFISLPNRWVSAPKSYVWVGAWYSNHNSVYRISANRCRSRVNSSAQSMINVAGCGHCQQLSPRPRHHPSPCVFQQRHLLNRLHPVCTALSQNG